MVVKIVATGCRILKLKCTKLQLSLDGFKGSTSKGRKGKGCSQAAGLYNVEHKKTKLQIQQYELQSFEHFY